LINFSANSLKKRLLHLHLHNTTHLHNIIAHQGNRVDMGKDMVDMEKDVVVVEQ
jgi:hypothetical protein